MKNCKKSKPCYYCKGLHNSAICFQKDKKGDSPKLAEEIKQDKKTESTENRHGCHVQSNVSLLCSKQLSLLLKMQKIQRN